ncbi:hypothetical protein [Neotamlana sedimentorum]|uniref:hypothetical protein n=1 Tax=Neotamlana sedimentorum TaxID=1435349 RepID=UPI0005CBBF2A|nr:hypothetical protein [Tamlana sedimentorum]
MKISKVFVSLIVGCFILFATFELMGHYNISSVFESLIVPLVAVAYFFLVKEKSIWFLFFLLFYSISDILGIFVEWIIDDYNLDEKLYFAYDYYIANLLYDLAYLCLLIEVSRFLSFSYVIKKLWIHLLVLTTLNIYLVYVLQLVSGSNLRYEFEGVFEIVYNSIVLSVLSVSLLNYFYNDNKKSLYLFLGSLSIVFSEVMDIAFIYVSNNPMIYIMGSGFTLLAFYFFYQQSEFANSADRFKILSS